VGIVAALLLGATFPLLVQSLNIGFYASIMAVTYLSLILSLWLLQVSWQTWGDPSAEMQDPIQPTSGRPEQVA
jgi:predicted ABC-type exoprotein transport system permease subunit